MIEAALYFALGALSVGLLLFVILPIVSGRARRLAIHELERQAPVSLSEITAQKDQMRARFAVELNRQEKRADQLQVESQQHLVTAEKWRIFAERVEQEFEKLKNDYATLKAKISSTEVSLDKQKEIAKSALKTMTGQEKKRLFELEDEVEELRSEKSAANVRLVAMQTEVNNAKSRVAEMERHMPSLEELNLRKELKALAEDVSAFVKSAPPPAKPEPPAPPEPVAPQLAPQVVASQVVATPVSETQLEPEITPEPVAPAQITVDPTPEIETQGTNTQLELTEQAEEQEKRQEESVGAMTVIPAFLKPAAERQHFDPTPNSLVPETDNEAVNETGIKPSIESIQEVSLAPESDGTNRTGLQFGQSQPLDQTKEPPTTPFSSNEVMPSVPQEPLGGTVSANATVAATEPARTVADPTLIDGSEALIEDSKDASLPDTLNEKITEHAGIAAIGSVKRIKSDKPSKTKKASFAGMIAAVSRGNKGAFSSGTNGKLKSGPVQSGSKMAVKYGHTRSGVTETTGLNGTKPAKATLEPAGRPSKDDSAAARKQRKIGGFGKKMRRGKTATASS